MTAQIPSKLESGEIAISMLGLWGVLEAAAQLSFLVPFILADDGVIYGGPLQFVPLFVWACSALVLVVFRRELAAHLFANQEPAAPQSVNETSEWLQDLLFSLVGLWVLVGGISYCVEVEVELWRDFSDVSRGGLGGDRLSSHLSADSWIRRIPYLVKIVLGLLLFFCAGRISRMWILVRSAGRERTSSAA